MLKVEDILEVLNSMGVTKAQFASFFQRAVLLTQLQELNSKVSNLQAQQSQATQEYASQIQTVQGQASNLQKQIDALGG